MPDLTCNVFFKEDTALDLTAAVSRLCTSFE
jgi:hypothetical protein